MTTRQSSAQTAKFAALGGILSLAASATAASLTAGPFLPHIWFAGWITAWLSGTLTSAIQRRGVGADYIPFLLCSYAGIAIRPFVVVLAVAVAALLCSPPAAAAFIASILSAYAALMVVHVLELARMPEMAMEQA